ncbi:MAG TPA: YiiD C-terminal domain-containing protein [Tahibacter sp.]|jgi:thioesterase domain-containing protein|nr:YiiD C-terminal domain-containing protein [Tahibacter sp.]
MNTSIRALEREMLADIPLARAIDLRIADADGDSLTLAAPLEPNINDKGCAFGGSLASLLTLAGWSLLSLRLRIAGEDCDVYVQDSRLRYLAPVWGDLRATARLADGEDWKSFFGMLAARGKSRLRVLASVPGENGAAATTLEARFVALRRVVNLGAA